MSKHTPGPWHNGRDATGQLIICEEYDTPNLYFEPNLEYQANCRLVSAAPDLLSVLTEFKIASDKQDSTFDGAAWLERVDAAIAKATGGAT